jgi:hypothetical protein
MDHRLHAGSTSVPVRGRLRQPTCVGARSAPMSIFRSRACARFRLQASPRSPADRAQASPNGSCHTPPRYDAPGRSRKTKLTPARLAGERGPAATLRDQWRGRPGVRATNDQRVRRGAVVGYRSLVSWCRGSIAARGCRSDVCVGWFAPPGPRICLDIVVGRSWSTWGREGGPSLLGHARMGERPPFCLPQRGVCAPSG